MLNLSVSISDRIVTPNREVVASFGAQSSQHAERDTALVERFLNEYHCKPPVAIIAPNFVKLVSRNLETSFRWKYALTSRKYALTPRKYALTSRKYALTSPKDFKRILLRDFSTIFGFMAQPPHRGFTMILILKNQKPEDPIVGHQFDKIPTRHEYHEVLSCPFVYFEREIAYVFLCKGRSCFSNHACVKGSLEAPTCLQKSFWTFKSGLDQNPTTNAWLPFESGVEKDIRQNHINFLKTLWTASCPWHTPPVSRRKWLFSQFCL